MNNEIKIKSQGVILIVVMISIVISAGVYFVVDFTGNKSAIQQKQKTQHSLAKAKQALIDYAISYYENESAGWYGVLPCPELSGSISNGRQQTGGCGAMNRNVIGRLPWFTLGIPPLVDASGECLWYAVSGGYKWSSSAKSRMHNADTPGMLKLFDENAKSITSNKPEDRIVALVIAAEAPINAQSRPAAKTNIYCRVAQDVVDINDYLEVYKNIDNTAVSSSTDNIDEFITAQSSSNKTINDQMIAIYQSEIFTAIQQNIAFKNRLTNLTEILTYCVSSYGKMQSCPAARACMNTCETEYDSCVLNTGNSDACRITRSLCLNGNSAANNTDCKTLCQAASSSDPDLIIDQMILPRPAAMNLTNLDYRISDNYLEISSADEIDVNKGLFGRYMYDVSQSINGSGITNIFDACGVITTPNVTVNMVDKSSPYRRLYNDWKDHFFYVVGRDMTSSSSSAQCNTDCPKVGESTVMKPAVVWFSAERLNNQRRLSRPPEAIGFSIASGDEKSQFTNYLELLDTTVFPDERANKTYQKDNAISNDIAFCINQDMSVSRCLE